MPERRTYRRPPDVPQLSPRKRAADLVRGDVVWTIDHQRWVTVLYPLGDPFGYPDALLFRDDGHEPYPVAPDTRFYVKPSEVDA